MILSFRGDWTAAAEPLGASSIDEQCTGEEGRCEDG